MSFNPSKCDHIIIAIIVWINKLLSIHLNLKLLLFLRKSRFYNINSADKWIWVKKVIQFIPEEKPFKTVLFQFWKKKLTDYLDELWYDIKLDIIYRTYKSNRSNNHTHSSSYARSSVNTWVHSNKVKKKKINEKANFFLDKYFHIIIYQYKYVSFLIFIYFNTLYLIPFTTHSISAQKTHVKAVRWQFGIVHLFVFEGIIHFLLYFLSFAKDLTIDSLYWMLI